MKHNNRNIFWTTFIIAVFICSWTKISYAQSVFGVQAGVNISSIRTTDAEGGKSSSDPFPGLRVGLTADIPVALQWSVQPGIFYSQRGFKEKTGGYNGSADNFKVRANYVELPVNFIYRPYIGNLHLLVGAGVYGAYGTSGNWKADDELLFDDIRIAPEGDVVFSDDQFEGGDLETFVYGKPFDYGANFLVGYRLSPELSVQVQAQFGFADLTASWGDFQPDSRLKNRNMAVSVGYRF